MNYHIVQKGESLWQIAKMHNISLQVLMDANPQLSDPNAVTVGEKIFIPENDEWKIPEPPLHNNTQVVDGNNEDIENEELCKKLAALPRPLIYVVKKGDSLYKISKCFDIGLKELLQVNCQIRNPDLISPGDKIFIPRSKNIYFMNNMTPVHNPDVDFSSDDICPYCGRPMHRK
ncbi:MAG: LysM peptidoglycan-binding domain-containing protein [Bacillota bacterium]|jgi:morphogenetic protein associated with SpoVID